MEKIFNFTVILMFCAVIFIVPIKTFTSIPEEYTIYENRKLKPLQEFTTESLFKGEYLSQFSEYFTDRIWKRTFLMKAYSQLYVNILNKLVVNNVVIQEGLLLPYAEYAYEDYNFEEPAAKTAENLSILKSDIEKYGGKFIYVGVPEQMSMLREHYPKYLENNDAKLSLMEKSFFDAIQKAGIENIRMRKEFSDTEDYKKFYSKTDHHYNLFGAYYTYQQIIQYFNENHNASLPMLEEKDFDFVKLENPFYGTRFRKLFDAYDIRDNLYYYKPNNPIAFDRWNEGMKVDSTVFTLPPDETTPIVYGIYMGNDYSETVIKTYRDDLPNVLIFGESFTNPVETFLYNSFNTTVSLDLRFYKKKTIRQYIEEYKPDYVICIRDDTAYFNFKANGNIAE